MQNKWLLYLALGFILFGMIGWTRTAYYLWTNPEAYREQSTVPDGNGGAPGGGTGRNGSPMVAGEDRVPRDEDLKTRQDGRSQRTDAAVQKAVAHLSARLGVSGDSVRVVDVREMVWPDGSLGCPRPGTVAAQVQQEGLLIQLEASGRIHAYHSGPDREPFLCDD